MNGFNRSHMYRTAETEKKGRKVKNRENTCKCFPPFVKLHYHDCPVVMKPCPIHGNIFQHTQKEQKVEREQNVIISFHPSTETERLLQPIKTFLSQCNSETKINFQYYSPDKTGSRESAKAQNGQNVYENLKRSLNTNVFVEKTKSVITNKTSKVKKLKQCFHSPCNSIVQKTRSQTSIKEKINRIFQEEANETRNVFYKMVPEIPPDDKMYNPNSKWFKSNKGSFKQDLLSEENLPSDFITVTQQDKNNAIHHKVFEIKHRKGLNDPFVGFPKPTHLVYSTVNVQDKQLPGTSEYVTDKHFSDEGSAKEKGEETGKDVDVVSEKTTRSNASTSSGSVYITPFILVPNRKDETDTESKSVEPAEVLDEAVQVEDLYTTLREGIPKETQTTPQQSTVTIDKEIQSRLSPLEEPKYRAVKLQTDSLYYEEVVCRSPRPYVRDYGPQAMTRVEEIDIGNERAIMTRNYDDSYVQYKRSEAPRRTPDSCRSTRTREIQMPSVSPFKEVLITARWDSRMRNQCSQTDDSWKVQVSVNTFDSRTNKSQCTLPYYTEPQVSDKGIQVAPYMNTPEDSEFINLNSSDVTYVVKPFEQQESDQAIDKLAKTWWGKSQSDSALCDRMKCCCKGGNENTFPPSEFSKQSEVNNTSEKNTYKIYESKMVPGGTKTFSKAGNITLRTKETVERISDNKHTSTREEEISAPVSDLSELKKIIQEFFEKGNLNSRNVCMCDRVKIADRKTDVEVRTDSFTPPTKQDESRKIFFDMPATSTQPVKTEEVETAVTEKLNVGVQAVTEKPKKADVSTEAEKVKNHDAAVQIDESEGEKSGMQRVILRRTVVVGPENRAEMFFTCDVCGREIRNSADAQTNTETQYSHQFSEQQPKPVSAGAQNIVQPEAKPRTKKVQNSNPLKEAYEIGILNSDENVRNSKVTQKVPKPQEDPCRTPNLQSRIPVSSFHSTSRVKCKTFIERDVAIFCPEWSERKTTCVNQSSQITKKSNCIFDPLAGPSRSCEQRQSILPATPTNTETKGEISQTKPGSSSSNKREVLRGQNNRTAGCQKDGSKPQRQPNVFPVLFTPIWPKDFLKTWQSMEHSVNDTHANDDFKTQTTKQKRRCEKDTRMASGKKIKVEAEQPSGEYLAQLSELLGQDQIENIEICSDGFLTSKPKSEDDRNPTATDEESLENYEDFLPESEHFSDSNNNTDNSSLRDEEEGEEERVIEETRDQQFYSISTTASKLKPQSHSAISLNELLCSDATPASKSLNAFWFFINPVKLRKLVENNRND